MHKAGIAPSCVARYPGTDNKEKQTSTAIHVHPLPTTSMLQQTAAAVPTVANSRCCKKSRCKQPLQTAVANSFLWYIAATVIAATATASIHPLAAVAVFAAVIAVAATDVAATGTATGIAAIGTATGATIADVSLAVCCSRGSCSCRSCCARLFVAGAAVAAIFLKDEFENLL